jgi:fatty-acyl-CoA synthase
LSYVYTTCNVPLLHKTFIQHLEENSIAEPDKVIYIFQQNDDLELTNRAVRDQSYLLAQNMMKMGLKKGDRVTISFPNTFELVIFYFACAYTGIIGVPLEPEWARADLLHVLKKIKPVAFFVYDTEKFTKFRDINNYLVNSVVTEEETKDNAKHLIVLGEEANVNKYKFDSVKTWSYTDLATNKLTENDLSFPFIGIDDSMFIIFTSGTTSRKKGVVVRQTVVNNGRIFRYIPSRQEDFLKRLCYPFAMYHIGAILGTMGIVTTNRMLVFPSYNNDTLDIIRSIQKFKCDSIFAPPKT